MTRPHPARPGPARLTLIALVAVPAVMAYPWATARHQLVAGVAVAVTVALLASWRGHHLSTMLARWVALLRRNRRGGSAPAPAAADTVTVLAAVSASAGDTADGGVLPLPIIAGYLHRYGVRCEAVRVISCDTPVAGRSTWIALTVSAAANLSALRGRSADIPLQRTAESTIRRLADQLREGGWPIALVHPDDAPAILTDSRRTRETWRGVHDDSGLLVAYRIAVDEDLSRRLAQVWADPSPQIWTVLTLTGDPQQPRVAADCALRHGVGATTGAPPTGVIAHDGLHRPALAAMDPRSTLPRPGGSAAAAPSLTDLRWPAGRAEVTAPRG